MTNSVSRDWISIVTSGSKPSTAAEVLALLEQQGTRTVIVGGCDTHGVMRGKRIPVDQVPRILERGLSMSEEFWVIHVDQSGFVSRPDEHCGYFPTDTDGFPDLVALPDFGTWRNVPWHDNTALLLCDWFSPRLGAPVPLSPRGVLKRVIERARAMGYEPYSALELEFYLLREQVGVAHKKCAHELVPLHDVTSTYGVLLGSLQEGIGGVIRARMQEHGLPVESCNPESGPGQFEMTLRYGPALSSADDAFLFKSGVKEIAAQSDLLATFMAKPNSDWPGNSCHVHVSLKDNSGHGCFFDPDAPMQLSSTAKHFIGGTLATMREFTALMAPTPNSYRRLMPHCWAGSTATWGIDNRSTGVRVISEGEHGTRVEHRQPGADCNPYLAAAATIAAGLHGIANKIDPPPPSVGNVYNDPPDPQTALPSTLAEAIEHFATSEAARDWFGADFVDHYTAMKRAELASQSLAVTDWEVSRYLETI